MKAIVSFGSHQVECAPGASVVVNRLDKNVDEEFDHASVQWLSQDGDAPALVGKPHVAGASVKFRVVRHFRGPKGIVFKKRSKKAWKKKMGFRAELTELQVQEIQAA